VEYPAIPYAKATNNKSVFLDDHAVKLKKKVNKIVLMRSKPNFFVTIYLYI
jgi:hypothetical protein